MAWILFVLLHLRLLLLHNYDLALQPPVLFHSVCLSWVEEYRLHSVFSGLICGHALEPNEKNLFLNLGVYHWFVASGGHLIFLQTTIEMWLTKNKILIAILLFLYSLVCGFQPPMVRSLSSIGLSVFSSRFALFLNPTQICLNSGLLTLLLFPDWYNSFSLQLSWLTALALHQTKSESAKSFMVSIYLFPLSQTWSALHLFYNVLLTPLFSKLLFPMTFLFFLLAPITSFGSVLWTFLLKGAEVLPSQQVHFSLNSSPTLIWIYIGLLQGLQYLKTRARHDS
jgi:predicted membrane metal-binding protein